MRTELLRNASFERGNADFWAADSPATTITAQTEEKKRGSFGGKIVCDTMMEANARTNDYITCSVGEIFKFTTWIKSVLLDSIAIEVVWYDGDLNEVGTTTLYSLVGTLDDFTLITAYFPVVKEASYLRILFSGWNAFPCSFAWYVDSASLQRVKTDRLGGTYDIMAEKTNLTTLGTFYGDEFFSGIWREAEYHLYCTAFTGTSPTLDVVIEGYDPNSGQWKEVLAFQQLTAPGGEFKTVLSGLGWKQRVKYTLGGTAVTDCDFDVGVVYKR